MENFNLINNENNRDEKKLPPKKKFDFKCYQKNTVNSLKDVDHFLNNFQYYFRYFKLYKLFKK